MGNGNGNNGTETTAGAAAEKGRTVKVKFKNAYMGDLGNFQAGKVYELPAKAYAVLKNDCEEIK